MAGRKKSTSAGSVKRVRGKQLHAHGYCAEIAEPTTPEVSRKKNLRLHQSKIDAARAILGTATETETIETALDLIIFRSELVEGVRAMRGANLVNLFDEA